MDNFILEELQALVSRETIGMVLAPTIVTVVGWVVSDEKQIGSVDSIEDNLRIILYLYNCRSVPIGSRWYSRSLYQENSHH